LREKKNWKSPEKDVLKRCLLISLAS